MEEKATVRTMMARTGDRESVLAQRLAGHGLQSASTALDSLDVVLCGFRHDRSDSGLVSLAMRVGWNNARRARNADALVTVMAARGAPHVHRRVDLPTLRAAMTVSEEDLAAMVGDRAARFMRVADPVGEVAAAMAEVVGEAGDVIGKADLSGAITSILDPELVVSCERCESDHVEDALFRLATLRASLELVEAGRGQAFAPTVAVDPTRPDHADVVAARRSLVAAAAMAAVRTTPTDLATWFGWHPTSAREVLDGDDDRPRRSRTTRTLRLLPPRDPWMSGSDRGWLLGDSVERRAEVFRSLGAPGVLLCDGEIVGTWRQRIRSSIVAIELDPWRPLTDSERDEVAVDADTLAACRDRTAEITG